LSGPERADDTEEECGDESPGDHPAELRSCGLLHRGHRGHRL